MEAKVQILSLRPAFSRTLRSSPEQPKRAAAHANTAPSVLTACGIVGSAPDLVAPAVQNNLQVGGCRAIRHRCSPNVLYRGFDIGDVQVSGHQRVGGWRIATNNPVGQNHGAASFPFDAA